MITLFNRKELFATFDLQKQSLIRDALAAAGIEYIVRTKSHKVSSGHHGNRGVSGYRVSSDNRNQYVGAYDTEYLIYVKKDEYEWAARVINRP